jgi:hypothetical protein
MEIKKEKKTYKPRTEPTKESAYRTFVKQYATDNNIGYKTALQEIKAKKLWKKDENKEKKEEKQTDNPFFIFVKEYAKEHNLGYKTAMKEVTKKGLYTKILKIPPYETIRDKYKPRVIMRVKHAILNIIDRHPEYINYNGLPIQLKERLIKEAGGSKLIKKMDPTVRNDILINYYTYTPMRGMSFYNRIMNQLHDDNFKKGISVDNLHYINTIDEIQLMKHEVQELPSLNISNDASVVENLLKEGDIIVKQPKIKRKKYQKYTIDREKLKQDIVDNITQILNQDFNETNDTISLLHDSIKLFQDATYELQQTKFKKIKIEYKPIIQYKEPSPPLPQPKEKKIPDKILIDPYGPKKPKEKKTRERKAKSKPIPEPEEEPPAPIPEPPKILTQKEKNEKMNELKKQREQKRKMVDKMTDDEIKEAIFKINRDTLYDVIQQEYDPAEIPADIPSNKKDFETYIDRYFNSSDELKDLLYNIFVFD